MRSQRSSVFIYLKDEEPELWFIQSPWNWEARGVASSILLSSQPELSGTCCQPFIFDSSRFREQRFSRTIYPQTIIICRFKFHHPECALLCLLSIKPVRHVITRIYIIKRPNGVLYFILIAGVQRRVLQGFPVLNITRKSLRLST
jgi:hypothetical protein